MATPHEMIEVDGIEVKISNPDKLYFPGIGKTKMDLVRYYLSVMPGVMKGAGNRPSTMYRWPNGVDAPDDAFYQKRVTDRGRPEWLQTSRVTFPSGRTADMVAIVNASHIAWMVNMGCIDLNPWPVRIDDTDQPDEMRVDLDPTPEIPYSDVCKTAPVVNEVLAEHGLVGWPKTSGKRGMHVYVRIEPAYSFNTVRRAALALAREVERRLPGVATTAWWKEERHGVFVDYNQNARDRTIASVYSVRPVAEATVSYPLAWDDINTGIDPADFHIENVPELFEKSDAGAGIDDAAGKLESLLELADRDEKEGLGDAPWPPHFPKAEGEPARVQPSRRRKA